MEIYIGIAAVIITLWQLKLQKKEMARNGEINTLVHISTLLKDKIDFHDAIIESMKIKKQPWQGHANKINDELRPLLDKVNKDLFIISSEYKCSFEHPDVEKALKITRCVKLVQFIIQAGRPRPPLNLNFVILHILATKKSPLFQRAFQLL